jgi:hypothetical protein
LGNLLSSIVRFITALVAAVQYLGSLNNRRPFISTHRPFTRSLTIDVDLPKEKSMIEFQIDMEQLFNKNQLIPRISAEFKKCDDFDFLAHMKDHKVPQDFGVALLVQMVLHKRATLPTLVGALRHHFNGNCQKTTDELLRAVEADLVDWNPTTRQFIIKFGISQDVQDEIDRYQFPLPMVVAPLKLESNKDTGYYTGKGSVILRHNHTEDDVCLDHLNSLNSMKLRVNQDVATTVKNRWKNLDKAKPDETPDEFQKRVKAFEKYNRTAFDVMHHLGLAGGGECYLTHKYDKRGRTYCQGYSVTYQGTPWNKAMIEFAEGEVVSG